MPDVISTILNYLKPGLPVYFAITTASFFLLIAPQETIDWLGMPEGYRSYAGTAFVLGLPLLVFTGLAKADAGLFFNILFMKFGTSIVARGLRKEFDKLPFPERCLIAHIVESHEPYFRFPPDNPIVQSLVDKGWARHPPGRGRVMFKFDGSKWRRIEEHLREHVRRSCMPEDPEEKKIVPMIKHGLEYGRV